MDFFSPSLAIETTFAILHKMQSNVLIAVTLLDHFLWRQVSI